MVGCHILLLCTEHRIKIDRMPVLIHGYLMLSKTQRCCIDQEDPVILIPVQREDRIPLPTIMLKSKS
jgi:hypothetical protein